MTIPAASRMSSAETRSLPVLPACQTQPLTDSTTIVALNGLAGDALQRLVQRFRPVTAA